MLTFNLPPCTAMTILYSESDLSSQLITQLALKSDIVISMSQPKTHSVMLDHRDGLPDKKEMPAFSVWIGI